jgi:hypothetical protein
VLEADIDPVRRQLVPRPVGPLDDGETAGVQGLLPAGGSELALDEAVEIEVVERQPAAEVLVEDHERRAGHGVLVDAEADRDPAGEHGLPGAELAPQRDDVTRLGVSGQAFAEPLGVQRGVAHDVDRAGVSLGAADVLRTGGVHERAEC